MKFLLAVALLFHLPVKRIAIINYTATKVYCWGFFRYAWPWEKKKFSKSPLVFFKPLQKHGWGICFYNLDEVVYLLKHDEFKSDQPNPTSKVIFV